jgi:threonyl-tRNA synthetase
MLPVWISPAQVRIIPIAKQFVKQGVKLLETLERAGIRADLDDRDDTMQSKVRDAELSWIPYTIIYGEKEIKTKELSIRSRSDSKESKVSLTAFLKRFRAEVEGYPVRPLTYPVLLSQRPGYKRM